MTASLGTAGTAAPSALPRSAAAPGSLAEQAYLHVQQRLVLLDIAPGAPIRESELAAELGIGRTPLREALKMLENDHLVVSYPRRGTFATAVDITDLADISEMRLALEPLAARRAAASADPAIREAMEAELSALRTLAGSGAGTPEAESGELGRLALQHDLTTHRLLYSAADNPYLAETLIRLHHLATRIWCLLILRLKEVPQHIGEHVGLLQAVLDGDPDAAERLAREHVANFETMVRDSLNA